MGEYTMRLITMWPESKENFIPLLLNFTFDSNLSIYLSIDICKGWGCVSCSVSLLFQTTLDVSSVVSVSIPGDFFFFKIPHSLLLFHLSGVDFPEVCCLIVPSLFGLSTEYSYNNVLMTTKYSGARTSTC